MHSNELTASLCPSLTWGFLHHRIILQYWLQASASPSLVDLALTRPPPSSLALALAFALSLSLSLSLNRCLSLSPSLSLSLSPFFSRLWLM